MPPSLSAHLRGLSPTDFEALLQRRVEVKTYLGGQWRKDMGTLADLLGKPSAIHEAVASLNSFLTQLLQLAVWLGPRVTGAELAATPRRSSWNSSGAAPRSSHGGAWHSSTQRARRRRGTGHSS